MSSKSIAVFVPHLGCPCQCTFCNQRAISGKQKMPTENEIEAAVKTAVLFSAPQDLELAYFGGSFTMIERHRMVEYLEIAKRLVEQYGLHGIRFSTRPDGIDESVMELLSLYPVTTVELGMQSADNAVLEACRRGCSSDDIIRSARLVKQHAIRLVLQMMVGLPESTEEKEMQTAKTVVELKADGVRIYPLLVLKNTQLAKENYQPLSLEEAVNRCAELMLYFVRNGVEIVKVGLNAEAGFDNGILVRGPYHPAFRELCEGKIFLSEILERYPGGRVTVCCHPKNLSQVRGHKNCNMEYLETRYPDAFKILSDERVPVGTVQIQKRAE